MTATRYSTPANLFTRDSVIAKGVASGRFRSGVVHSDLATPEVSSPGTARVLWGAANGQFTLRPHPGETYELERDPPIPWLKDPYGVATGELNFDNKLDFVVACQHGDAAHPHGGVAIFVGKNDGTFVEPAYVFYADEPQRTPKPCFVKVADMNQDGFQDVITSNRDSQRVGVLIAALQVIPAEP